MRKTKIDGSKPAAEGYGPSIGYDRAINRFFFQGSKNSLTISLSTHETFHLSSTMINRSGRWTMKLKKAITKIIVCNCWKNSTFI